MSGRHRTSCAAALLTIACFALPTASASAQTGARRPLADVTTTRITLPGDQPGIVDTPQNLAVAPNAVWITEHRAGRVVRVDPRTDEVVAAIDVPVPGCGPQGCLGLTEVVADARNVWVVNNDQAQLVHIDARTNRVVGSVPTNGAVSGLVLDGDAVWVAVSTSGDVLRISARSHAVTRRLHAADGVAWPLAIVDGGLWVGTAVPGVAGTERLRRIDLGTGRITHTVRDRTATGATVVDGDLWLTGCVFGGGPDTRCTQVARIDGRTGRTEATLDFEANAGTSAPAGDGLLAVGLDLGPGRPFWLAVVDTKSNTVTAEYEPPPGDAPPGLAYGHRALWVTDWSANTVSRVELRASG